MQKILKIPQMDDLAETSLKHVELLDVKLPVAGHVRELELLLLELLAGLRAVSHSCIHTIHICIYIYIYIHTYTYVYVCIIIE